MAVTQETVLGSGQAEAATGLVEHNKVVARTLHFGKRNSHGRNYHPLTP
jgi:hypothetical protein